MREVHLEWGGTQDDHPKWGGVPKYRRKWGGLMRGRRPREKGHPPSACFWHLPLYFVHMWQQNLVANQKKLIRPINKFSKQDLESKSTAVWKQLHTENYFYDVTMACEDGQIQTHKIIISHSIPVLKNEENNIGCSIIFKMRNLLIKMFITYLV